MASAPRACGWRIRSVTQSARAVQFGKSSVAMPRSSCASSAYRAVRSADEKALPGLRLGRTERGSPLDSKSAYRRFDFVCSLLHLISRSRESGNPAGGFGPSCFAATARMCSLGCFALGPGSQGDQPDRDVRDLVQPGSSIDPGSRPPSPARAMIRALVFSESPRTAATRSSRRTSPSGRRIPYRLRPQRAGHGVQS
jgi:hypothetical protein